MSTDAPPLSERERAELNAVSDVLSRTRQAFGKLPDAFNAVVVAVRELEARGLLVPGALRDEHFFGANAALEPADLLEAVAAIQAIDTFAAANGHASAVYKVKA